MVPYWLNLIISDTLIVPYVSISCHLSSESKSIMNKKMNESSAMIFSSDKIFNL